MKNYVVIGEIIGRGIAEICGREFEFVRKGDEFYLIDKKFKERYEEDKQGYKENYEKYITFRLDRVENKHVTWYINDMNSLPSQIQGDLEHMYQNNLKKKENQKEQKQKITHCL